MTYGQEPGSAGRAPQSGAYRTGRGGTRSARGRHTRPEPAAPLLPPERSGRRAPNQGRWPAPAPPPTRPARPATPPAPVGADPQPPGHGPRVRGHGHPPTGRRPASELRRTAASVAEHAGEHPWPWIICGVGALVLLTVCGLGTYFLVLDERQGHAARAPLDPTPTALPRDISSRAVDPEPLRVDEVFPDREIVIDAAEPPYQVLRTQAARDCRAAVAGDLVGLLGELDCSQVVRGTLRSPTRAYLVTAGILNLGDATLAERARQRVKPIVEGRKGRFQGMRAGRGTDPVVLSSAQVGWHVRGHFLMYCVVAKADGTAITDGDPYVRQILFDLIELHLRFGVLQRRATVPVVPPAGPSPATPAAALAGSGSGSGSAGVSGRPRAVGVSGLHDGSGDRGPARAGVPRIRGAVQ